MSEIPEDIMQSAKAAYEEADSHHSWAGSTEIIARAILAERQAERERCAKRVYDSVDEVPWLNRTELSEAIRNQKP